jgi:post-segregation antitoxin (ccd killing protein)
MASEYTKVSVTLPAPLIARIKARVGARGVSRYVAQALEAEERREALRAWLTSQDDEHGSIPPEVMEEVRREWLGGASLAG